MIERDEIDPRIPLELSAAGRQRQMEILRLARAEAGRRQLGRHTLRGGAAVLSLALCAAGVLVFRSSRLTSGLAPHDGDPRPSIARAPGESQPAPAVASPRAVVLVGRPRRAGEIAIGRIETDPAIATSLAMPPQRPTWQKLTDDQLLERLAENGRPAGLAFVDGRAVVLYRGKSSHQ
jgi:hypothetical protein